MRMTKKIISGVDLRDLVGFGVQRGDRDLLFGSFPEEDESSGSVTTRRRILESPPSSAK